MGLFGNSKLRLERMRQPILRTESVGGGAARPSTYKNEVAEVVMACKALDHSKIHRQFTAARAVTSAPKRAGMLKELEAIYVCFDIISVQNVGRVDYQSYDRQIANAKVHLSAFEELAGKLSGWQAHTGAVLPRPFQRRSLERLFWQANRILGKGGRPYVDWKAARKRGDWDD